MKWLVILAVVITACSPLKRVQRSENTESTVNDKTVTELIKNEVEKRIGSLSQTIVEFYPPVSPVASDSGTVTAVGTSPKITPQPPVKRIVHTEISTQADRYTATDSTVKNNINTVQHSDTTEKVVEKPPATVTWMKWAAVALGVILLIIIALKI